MIYTDRFSSLDLLPDTALQDAISHSELRRLFENNFYIHADFQKFGLGVLMRRAYKESVDGIIEYELGAGGYKIMTESYIRNWRKNPSYTGGKILGGEDAQIVGILGYKNTLGESKSERLFMAGPHPYIDINPNFDEIYNELGIESAVGKILKSYRR